MTHTCTDAGCRAQADVTLRDWLYRSEKVDSDPGSLPWTNTAKPLLALVASAEHAAPYERLPEYGILSGLRIKLS